MHCKLPLLRCLSLLTVLTLGGPVACGKKDAPAGFVESGRKYFEAGQLEKAKNEYLKALEKEPGNMTAIKQLGLIWLEQGAPMMAANYLLQASKRNPEDTALRKKLVQAFQGVHDYRSAAREAIAVLDASPADGEALLLLLDTCFTPAELNAIRPQVGKFPNRNSAAWNVAAARFFAVDGDNFSAREALDKALATDPKFLPALAIAARTRAAEKDWFGAEEAHKASISAAPLRSRARIDYANYFLAKREEEKAFAVLAELTAAAPDYLPGWQAVCDLNMKAQRFDEALATVEKILAIDPENYGGLMSKAQALNGKKQYAAALAALQPLTTHPAYSHYPSFLRTIAQTHVLNGEPEKGVPFLDDGVARFKETITLRVDLANLHLTANRPDRAIEVLEEGLERANARIAELEAKGLRVDPEEKEAAARGAYILALAYQMKGKLPHALDLLQQVIAKSNPNPELQTYLGRMLVQSGNLAGAVTAFETALKLDPENKALFVELVDVEVQLKHFDQAMKRVETALAKQPKSAELYFLKGKIYFAAGKWDQAEAALKESSTLDPKAAGPAQLLVETSLRSGNAGKALEQLEANLKVQPDNIQALQSAARIYEERKDFDKAREKYEKLSEAAPRDAMPPNNLAMLYAGPLKDLEKAAVWADKAKSRLPADDPAASPGEKRYAASVKDTCSHISYMRGRYAEAYTFGRDAAAAFPGQPEVHYHFGMAAAAMGRTAEAGEALTVATAGTDDYPGKDEAKQRLEQLKTGGQMTVPAAESLLQKNPKDVVLQDLLADAVERSGDHARAAVEYGKVTELNPGHVPAALKKAKLLALYLNKKPEALAIAKERRASAEDDPALVGTLGAVLYESGALNEARQVLLTATRSATSKPEDLRYLALSTYSQGDVSAARAEMKKALAAFQKTPGHPLIAESQSFLDLTEPHPASAPLPQTLTALAKKTLQEEPENVPALMIRAGEEFATDEQAAKATLDIVLRKFPDFPPALKKLAVQAAATEKNVDKGLEWARKAHLVLSNDGELSRAMGILSYLKKDFPSAVLYFEEAARKSTTPPDARSLCLQGLAYVQTGASQNAKETLEAATKAGLAGDLSAQAAAALKKLDSK